jgi:RNA polymerase sigma-70 factor (sigma-E family)
MAGFMADDAGGQGGAVGAGRPSRGDAAGAVTDLFRDHHLELVRLAVLMVGNQATAEDVVQDAFERLHRGWHGLRQPSSGLAYVRSSVLNGCRSAHRRAAVARKHVPKLAGPADATSPDAASAADDRGEMAAALGRLPRRQREVLVLRYYLDLDVAEIAGTLRISPSAVRATNTRGLAALARALQED